VTDNTNPSCSKNRKEKKNKVKRENKMKSTVNDLDTMVETTVAVRMPDYITKVATVDAHLSGVVLVKCRALTVVPGTVVAVYTRHIVPHINILSAAHMPPWQWHKLEVQARCGVCNPHHCH